MSGTNHNMNHIVKRIETRVLAPPGGFSSISFGGAPPTGDVYRGHDFNPKNSKARFPKDPKGSVKASASNVSTCGRRGGQDQHASRRVNSRAADTREQSDKENKMRGYANRDRRDSLDELMGDDPRKPRSSGGGSGRVIPGLEDSRRTTSDRQGIAGGLRAVSPIDSATRGRHRSQQKINKSDYAEILRQQIATKKDLTDEDGFERSGRDLGAAGAQGPYPQYQQQRAEQGSHRRGAPRCDRDDHRQMEAYPQAGSSCTGRRSQYGSGGGRSSISLSWE